jgi:hypothetical protein
VDKGLDGRLTPLSSRSETLDTIKSVTPTATHRQGNLNHVPRPVDGEWDPKLDDLNPSGVQASLFTVIGGPEYQRPTLADTGVGIFKCISELVSRMRTETTRDVVQKMKGIDLR